MRIAVCLWHCRLEHADCGGLAVCCSKVLSLVYRPARWSSFDMWLRCRDDVLGHVERISSMVPRPFSQQEMLKTLDGPHKRINQRKNAFVSALGRRGAACCTVEQLAFTFQLRVGDWKYGIRVKSGALSWVF